MIKRMMVCLMLAFTVVSIAAEAVNYTRLRKRVVSREFINDGAQVVYTYQQGSKEWCETNTVKQLAVRQEIRYSKLKLILAAKAAGKWGDVKAFITANDMMDEWNACQYITSTHPAYIAATNAVISAGVASEADVQTFMKLAED